MKSVSQFIFPILVLIGSFFASSSMACTTSLWNGGVTGTPIADSPLAVSRVSGLCAMKLEAAGGVTDNSPSVEPTANIRFYVFAELNSGNPVIFEAFSADDAGGTSLITVTFNGTNFDIDAGATSSGAVPGTAGWNLVELAWTGGTGMDYWVNADSTVDLATGSVTAAAGTMESVVLGAAGSLDGMMTFDDYVSNRTSPVGALLMGDANGSESLTIADVIALFNELNGTLATGQPDCNSSGGISIADVICLFNQL